MPTLHSWSLVAAVYNLEVTEGMRPGPCITANGARAIGLRAMRSLRAALAAAGITDAEFIAYLRMRDATAVRSHENLGMLMPAPAATRDDADPDARRSLRKVV